MSERISCHPALPDYYLYEKDGKWFKTDAAMTKAISSHIFADKAVELPKIVFYPNWNAKGAQDAKYAAWRVSRLGVQVARWFWKVREHSDRGCRNCTRIDGTSRCAVKAPAMIEWSSVAGRWVLTEMEGKASVEEAKVLDSK